MRRVVAALFVVCLAASALAQESRFGATVEVSIVNVDVIVTDRSGRHVHGLSEADFEVLEDGVPQPVTNFTEYRGESAFSAAGSAASGEAPAQKRTIVVFVDRIPVHGRERRQLFDELKKFLRRSVRPGDAVAITSWSTGPRALGDFTDDIAALESAVDSLADEKRRIAANAADAIDFERAQLEWYYSMTNSSGNAVGTTVGQYEAAAKVVLDVRHKARTLDSLMQAMAGAQGQKAVVLVTHRFAPTSGAEFIGLGNKTAITADAQIDRMLATAKANGVRIYPLYASIGDLTIADPVSNRGPSALSVSVQQTLLRNIETTSLTGIAGETGGVAGTGLGDLEKLFMHLSEDLSSYYSLAYRATAPAERPKRLTVRVKNGAYRVRTRRDVVDKSSETLTRERILTSLLEAPKIEGLPVSVFLAKARISEGLIRLPLQIRVPLRALTLLPDGDQHSGGFSVYVGWAGELGTFGDIAKRHQAVSADPSKASSDETVLYEIEVAATRSVNRLVVAVVDDLSQEVGLVRFDMPKPKAK